MPDRWIDAEAERYRERYGALGEDWALRIYTARLLGSEPGWMVPGAAWVTLKRATADELLLPAPGRKPAELDGESWVALGLASLGREREAGRLEPPAEALLHAALPHPFVDETQCPEVLALFSQPDGETRVRAVFGERVGWVAHASSPAEVARAALAVYEKNSRIEGLVLDQRGLVTFGSDARTSYGRQVELIQRACEAVQERSGGRVLDSRPMVALRDAGDVAPILRGALAVPTGELDQPFRRWILEFRSSEELAHFAGAAIGAHLAAAPPACPAQVRHAGGAYLFAEHPPYADIGALTRLLRSEVESHRRSYIAWFDRFAPSELVPHEPTPRISILPGLGLFAAGETRRAARAAADVAEHAIRTKICAATIGAYEGMSEADLFDAEYSAPDDPAGSEPPEPGPLLGQVVLLAVDEVTRGETLARELIQAGACVLLANPDFQALEAIAERLDSTELEIFEGDVSDPLDARDAVRSAAEEFGGIDLLALSVDADRAEATGSILDEVLARLRQQGTGGSVALICSRSQPLEELAEELSREGGAHHVRARLLDTADTDANVLSELIFLAQHAAP